jgi:hypothetical protein
LNAAPALITIRLLSFSFPLSSFMGRWQNFYIVIFLLISVAGPQRHAKILTKTCVKWIIINYLQNWNHHEQAFKCVRELSALETDFEDYMLKTAELSPNRSNWGGREVGLVFLLHISAG